MSQKTKLTHVLVHYTEVRAMTMASLPPQKMCYSHWSKSLSDHLSGASSVEDERGLYGLDYI